MPDRAFRLPVDKHHGCAVPRGRTIACAIAALMLSPASASAQYAVLAHIRTATTPVGVAVNASTGRIYVAGVEDNSGAPVLTVVDGITQAVLAHIPTATDPVAVALDSSTGRIYIAGFDDTFYEPVLTVIDGTTHSLVAQIETGTYPVAIAVDSLTSHVYIAGDDATINVLTVVDGTTGAVTARIATRTDAVGVAVDSSTGLIYVAGFQDRFNTRWLTVVDRNTNSVVEHVPTDTSATAVAVDSATTRIYIAGYDHTTGSRVVTVVDGTSNSVVARITTDTDPNALAVDSSAGLVYVAGPSDYFNVARLTVVDATTDSVTAHVLTSTDAVALGADPSTGRIYVAGFETPTNTRWLTVVGRLGFTPVGENVSVELRDTATGDTPAKVTFTAVDRSGTTAIASSGQGPPVPPGYRLGHSSRYYILSTTASFTGIVTLCFTWPEGEFHDEHATRLFRYQSHGWTDVTASLDVAVNNICGQVPTLSLFALVEPGYVFHGFLPPVDNPPARNIVKSGAAVPIRFSLTGYRGLEIFDDGYPASRPVRCGTTEPLADMHSAAAAGMSTLSYDPLSDRYTYVWKTERSWGASCRELSLRFSDGTVVSAQFDFSR